MEWFEKLKRAKELLAEFTDQGADHLRTFARFTRELADSLDKAANSFDPTPNGPKSLGVVNQQELEGFLKDCQQEANQPHALTEANSWKSIAISFLIDVVAQLIDKYKQKPTT